MNKQRKPQKMKTIILTLLISCISLYAEIKLPALFSDGMVLQRDIQVPVWGWAEKGTKVEVSFAGQTKQTTTPESGKWMLKLDKLSVNAKPASMTIKVGNESKEIKDILVGEVWLCSGQSNMDFTLLQLSKATREPQYQPIADYITKEMNTASDSLLRQISVPRLVSPDKPQENFVATWKASNPENNKIFTGTGYFFARKLRQELKVPVGLIKAPWGGTLVEPWIPAEAFKSTDNEAIQSFIKSNIAAYKARAESMTKQRSEQILKSSWLNGKRKQLN